MLFATWNCFAIPYEIAFEPEIASHWAWTAFNACIDFFFFIDILITFRTTYLDGSGEEVSEPKKIVKHYLKGRFFTDMLATVPFDSFVDGTTFLSMFGLLKVARVFRLGRLINNLNVRDDIKMSFKLL